MDDRERWQILYGHVEGAVAGMLGTEHRGSERDRVLREILNVMDQLDAGVIP